MLKMTQKPVLDASHEERRFFAINFLGLDIEPTDSDDAILTKIMAAHDSEFIFIQATPEAVDQEGAPPPHVEGAREAPQDSQAMAGSLGRDDPKVVINIPSEERNGVIYDRDVEVGVNGRCWQLRRGVDIAIPYRVFLALEGATGEAITHVPVGSDVHEILTPVRRVNFSTKSQPTAAEIADWHARTDSAVLP